MLLKFKALIPDDISQNCQLYSINWKKTCWFFQRFIKQLSPDSKGEIVQFEAISWILKTKGNRVRQCQIQKDFVCIKAKTITLSNLIWVQIQAHKNKE